MKTLKLVKSSTLAVGLLSLSLIFSAAFAQEYDDMYFNKSDRKKVKTNNPEELTASSKSVSTSDYKEITESTEGYSSKNINPEYIAKYKSNEANERDQ